MTANEQDTQTIRLDSLVLNDAFQIRLRLDPATIERYVQSYKAEVPMPPIKVAMVDGAPVLVDGWHRVQAMRRAGIGTTEAIITHASKADALWMAAQANLTHGLPLKAREVRRVFKAYVRARRHRDERGNLKSFRVIARDLGRPHTTIRNWMMQDFPKIAANYSLEHLGHADGAPRVEPAVSFGEITRRHLTDALAAARGVQCARTRADLVQLAQEVLKGIQEGGPWVAEDDDF